MQSNYYVLFYMLSAKILILTVFTLMKKSKMATIFGDVTDHQQRHQP